jgi:predicted porin
LSLGAQIARRVDVIETADTTRDVAPTATSRTGSVTSVYAIAKPLMFINSAPEWPLGVVLRLDRVQNNVDTDPYQRNVIAGLSWDFNKRTSVYFDVQALQPKKGSTTADTRTFFLHVIANY